MPDIFTPKTVTQQPPTKATTDEAITVAMPAKTTVQEPTTNATPQEHHIHALAAFCEDPVGMSFQTQEADEHILLFLRRHFITNVPWILLVILGLFVPFLVAALIAAANSPFVFLPQQYVLVLVIFYYLVLFAYAFIEFITWYFNVSIVTEKRVIDVDFSELVYKNVAETKLSLVQDVDYTQVGVIASLFNFGDVMIHTAGDNPNFTFDQVPNPGRATSIIENLIGRGKGAV